MDRRGGGLTSDAGQLTWAGVVSDLFPPMALDAGFTLDFVPTSTNGKWVGGVLTTNGDVLPGVYDSRTNVLTLLDGGIPQTVSSGASYAGAVLLADGESALMIPRYARKPMLVTPTSATILPIADVIEGHSGGLLVPDESVLMKPNSSAEFVKWDGGSVSTCKRGFAVRGTSQLRGLRTASPTRCKPMVSRACCPSR